MKIRIDFTTILELQYLPASHDPELATIIQKAHDDVYDSWRCLFHWNSTWIEITEQQRDFLIGLIKSKMGDGTNMKWTAKAYHAIKQLNGHYK